MSAAPRQPRRAGAAGAPERPSAADIPARHRAKLTRLLRMMERESWDRERERRRRHEDILRKWPPLWGSGGKQTGAGR
jgi:hypothetical protein